MKVRTVTALTLAFAALAVPLAYSDPIEWDPTPIVLEATGFATHLDPALITVPDIPGVQWVNDSPSYLPVGNTTITWVALYDEGGHSIHKQIVTVRDTTPPEFPADAPTLIEATSSTGAAIPVHFDLPEATDLADIDVTVTSSHAPGSEFPLDDTVVTFTATDDSGNTDTHTMTVTVRDGGIPNFKLDSTHNVVRASWDALDGHESYNMTLIEAGSDTALQTARTSTNSHTFGGLEADTEYAVSVTTEDGSAGAEETILTLSPPPQPPDDAAPPTITAPGDVTKEATAPLTGSYLGSVTVSDDTDPMPVVSNDAPARFPVGSTTVTWTATDDSGNRATDTQTVTITDTTPPKLGYTNAYGLAYVDSPDEWTITVHPPPVEDLADKDVTVYVNRQYRDKFPLGLTEFLFTHVDDSKNRATATYRLYVVLVPLQLPPISDIRMTHNESVTIPLTLPLPHDDNSVSFSFSNGTERRPLYEATPRTNTASYSLVDSPPFAAVDHSVPGRFGTITLDPSESDVGTHTVTLHLVTGRHHASTSFEVTVTEPPTVPAPTHAGGSDDEPPTLTAPPEAKIEATAPRSFVHLGAPVTYDNADPDPAVSNDAPGLFKVGSTTVTWEAVDASGNSATDEQEATVSDTTPPMFHVSPLRGSTSYVQVNGSIINFKMAAVTDLVDGDVTVTSSPAPGSKFTRGVNYVEFTATDDSGNRAKHSWPLYVIDSYSPDPIGDVSMTHDETVTVPASIPIYPRHYTAYRLIDSPSFATIEHGGRGGQALITLDPSESDVGKHTVTVWFWLAGRAGTTDFEVSVGQPDASSQGGSRQVGPAAEAITIPVTDDYADLLHDPEGLAPILAAPPDMTAESEGLLTQVDIGEATVSGYDGPAPIMANNAPDGFPVGQTTVVWTATDAAGNTAVAFQTVTILQADGP